jgi:hypothetical protein
MTNKTEDRFYFGKHRQPERFSRMVMTSKGNYRTSLGRDTRVQIEGGKGWVTVDPAQYITPQRVRVQGTKGEVEVRAIIEGREIVGVTAKLVSSRHAQPEDFDLSEACWDGYEPVGTKRKDGRTVPNCVPMKNEKPERFGYGYRPSNILSSDLDYAISEIQKDMKHMTQVMQNVIKKNPLDAGWIRDTDALHNNLLNFIDRARGVLKHKDSQVQAKAKKAVGEVRAFLDKWEKMQARSRSGKAPFSCASQPEQFGAIEEAAKIRISDIQSGNEQQLNKIEPILQAAANMGDERAARYLKMLRFERKHLGTSVPQAPWHRSSRPGQPERFDASSLDRKGFAAASSSPMLGKLLSEKQMPEGGWRAVETGGDALVISFEDGDVAGNFARRVASHGYSATAPVQSIGRYWNVEVKNGK